MFDAGIVSDDGRGMGARFKLLRHKVLDSKFTRLGLLAFVAQMTVNVCNFAFHIVVSRRIGVAAYGSLNALVAAFNVCAVPAVILTTVMVKNAAELHASSRTADLGSFAKRLSAFSLVIAACVTALGLLAAPAIASYLKLSDVTPVALTVGILAFNLVLPMRGVLQGVEDFRSYAISLTSEAIVKVALALLFAQLGLGLAGALLGWLLGTAVSYAYTTAVVWWRFKGVRSNQFLMDPWRFLREGWSVSLATLFVTSMGFSDLVIVKHVFAPHAAGIYGAAALSGRMIFMLVSFVPIVVLPRVAHLANQGRRTRSVLYRALGLVAFLSAASTSLYYIRPALIVTTLAGSAYAQSAPLVFPYAVAASLLGFVSTLVYYRLGTSSYRFLIPFSAVAVGEIMAMGLFHSSPLQTVQILISFNCLALISMVFGDNKQRAQTHANDATLPTIAISAAEEALA